MLNIAVIGAGRIGKIHATNIARGQHTALAYVADPVPGAAEALAGPLGAQATLDAAEAITAPGTDAVLIGSPTPTHVDLILQAVAAGKPVLCEKPVDLDLARAEQCRDEVARAGGRVMIGFNRRFDPTFAKIRAAVADGAIGPLEQLVITSRDSAAPPASYVATSGGMFRDMSIHDLDMARFFCGPIASVQAVGQNVIDPGIEAAGDIDSGVIVLKATSGASATIINSRRCAFGYDQRLEAFGAEGMLQAANQTATSERLFTATHMGAADRALDFFLDRYADAYRLELDAFVAAVAGDAPFDPNLDDGVASLALADAALTSLTTGRTIDVGAL
jgi:myo-inositol 2-dehydrogenase/D-chiro-inositol 1-dehydrogenase